MKKLRQRYLCAVNGREALDAYRKTPADFFLILMDMSMPVMDGFAATGKIRQTEKKRRLPRITIIALTGLTNAEARARAFNAAVDEGITLSPVSTLSVMRERHAEVLEYAVKMEELKELIARVHRED